MFTLQAFAAIVIALSGTTLSAPADMNCTRALLESAVSDYIAAQTKGSSAAIKALSPSVVYTQNDKAASISTGILATPLTIDHNRSEYDTTACATYTELIVAKMTKPYVIGTQMRFTGGSITKVESLVTTTGDWLFNATGTLYYASKESWDTIPVAKQDSRAVIQAAADAYLDVFNNKSVVVPWGTPCDRLEGGTYMGKGTATDSCNVGVPSGVSLVNRRYVVDETIGTVDVFLNFGGATGMPDSHQFRIEGGKLRFVHTITVQNK